MSGGSIKKTSKKVTKKPVQKTGSLVSKQKKTSKILHKSTRKKKTVVGAKRIKKPSPINLKTSKTTVKKKPASKTKIAKRAGKQSRQDVKNSPLNNFSIPKARIIYEKNERSKIFLMWVGVSFFMILIIIFWLFSIKQNFADSYQIFSSPKQTISWGQMADELNQQINDFKKDLSSLHNFASSSQNIVNEDPSKQIFFSNQQAIENLKQKLENKIQASSTQKYYFSLSVDDEQQLLINIDKLKIGDSLKAVKDLLGEANFIEEIRDKRGVFVVKKLDYYIKILAKDFVNDKYDKYCSLEFDLADKLIKINKKVD